MSAESGEPPPADRPLRSGQAEDPPAAPAERRIPDLRSAMRVARIEDAERSRAVGDLRGAEMARLDLLREAIEPVLAQVPAGVEMFDAGLIPVPQPRLFVDMVAFVEMARDKRQYRFIQDTRQGRFILAESESLAVLRDAVTSYVARRLVEREKALAGAAAIPTQDRSPTSRPNPARFAWLWTPVGVALNYLGVVALCVLLWILGRAIYQSWPALLHR